MIFFFFVIVASNSTLNPHKLIEIFFIDLDRLKKTWPIKNACC